MKIYHRGQECDRRENPLLARGARILLRKTRRIGMAIVGGLLGILTYLLVIGVIGGILYFVVKAAVKEGMLDALEEWHKEHDGDGSF